MEMRRENRGRAGVLSRACLLVVDLGDAEEEAARQPKSVPHLVVGVLDGLYATCAHRTMSVSVRNVLNLLDAPAAHSQPRPATAVTPQSRAKGEGDF